MIVEITKENFEEEVLKCDKPVLIDFWADWCGPCKLMSPVIDQLAEEYAGQIKVGKVNVDEQAALALQYQVMSIPTLVVMKYGICAGKTVGVQSREDIVAMLALDETEFRREIEL